LREKTGALLGKAGHFLAPGYIKKKHNLGGEKGKEYRSSPEGAKVHLKGNNTSSSLTPYSQGEKKKLIRKPEKRSRSGAENFKKASRGNKNQQEVISIRTKKKTRGKAKRKRENAARNRVKTAARCSVYSLRVLERGRKGASNKKDHVGERHKGQRKRKNPSLRYPKFKN